MHVEKFFARNLGGLTRARTRAGPAREGRSRTPSMYADEKSDEVVVPRKRSNKGRQLPAEVVEGRASPEGNSRQAAVVRTLSRATTAIRLAAVRWCACGFKLRAADVRPEGGARCVSSARRDLCGGRSVMSVPTATVRSLRLYVGLSYAATVVVVLLSKLSGKIGFTNPNRVESGSYKLCFNFGNEHGGLEPTGELRNHFSRGFGRSD